MVDRSLIAAKLAELAERVARVRSRRPAGPDGFQDDRDAQDIVAFNLMLGVQSCLDVASHIIADESLTPATTLAESFDRLRSHGVVSAATAAALGRAAGLRNVVAHGYAGVDRARLHAAATSGLADLEQFAREVALWLGRTTS